MRLEKIQTTEKGFQNQIIHLMKTLHFDQIYHTYDSRRSSAGFPDLTVIKHDRLILIELKTDKGKLSQAQISWLLSAFATPIEVYLFRPRYMNLIPRVLQGFQGAMERLRAETFFECCKDVKLSIDEKLMIAENVEQGIQQALHTIRSTA